MRALARLIDSRIDLGGDPAPVLDRRALRKLTSRLVRSTHADRLAMRGMRRSRADLLPTGALILDTTAELLGLDGYTVCDWGLREGVLLETFC